jgi:hypothetical protein
MPLSKGAISMLPCRCAGTRAVVSPIFTEVSSIDMYNNDVGKRFMK